jgi:hypothetical protein
VTHTGQTGAPLRHTLNRFFSFLLFKDWIKGIDEILIQFFHNLERMEDNPILLIILDSSKREREREREIKMDLRT